MHKLGIKLPGYILYKNQNEFISSLDLIKDIGFTAIEFTPDSFDLIENGKIDYDILSQLSNILKKYKFECIIHVPLRLNLFNKEYDDLHEKVFVSSCEICKELGSRLLVHHPGRSHDNVDFPRMGKPERDLTFSELLIDHENRIIQDTAFNYPDITIALENHRPYKDYSPYSYAEFCTELAKQVNKINMPNVRINIDTGHLNLACAYHHLDIMTELDAILPLIAHCHLHDNHGLTNFYTDKDKQSLLPFGLGDEHTVPGRGTFPFNKFFDRMYNYKGTYIIELTSRYFHEVKILEAFNATTAFLNSTEKMCNESIK